MSSVVHFLCVTFLLCAICAFGAVCVYIVSDSLCGIFDVTILDIIYQPTVNRTLLL